MTQLETLIQTLCPNGVKFVKLGEVAEIQYGYPFNASLFTDEKNEKPIVRIRDIVPAKTSTYYLGDVQGLENYIIHKGDILLGMDGYFNMDKWDSEDAYLNQRVCKISAKNSEIVLDGFLFHYLKPQFKKIEQSTAGGSVIHLSAKIINNLQIPLPPLAVQSEIVRVLDKFTLYKSELAAELAARLQQYEYYRDQLLTFDDTVKRVKLGEVCNVKGRIGFRGYTRNDIVKKGEGAISLSPGNISGHTLLYNDCTYISWMKYDESPEIKVREGDVILCKTGSTLGKVAIVEQLPEKATINP